MKNTNVDMQLQALNRRMAKLFTKNYIANRNHIDKIERQMRYLEKQIRPENTKVEENN